LVLVLGFLALFFWSPLLLNLIANTGIEKKIYKVLNPLILNKGLRIVKIQLQKGKELKLLVFLDRIGGKITVDECAGISLEINSLLDVESIIKSPFRLEVSSAGIDRYLSSSDDFKKYQNYNVKVKSETYTGRGKLIDHCPNSLTLSNKNGETCLDLSRVLDVKIDLEGMSLETIKEMEFK
jgi:ribosome maturation factor RimP